MARIQVLSYSLLLLAFVSWGGLVYTTGTISAAATASASSAQTAQQQIDQLSYQKRLSSLAQETQEERAQLDTLSGADVVTIVTMLEQSDPTKRLGVKVNDAQAEGSTATLPGGSLNSLGFVIEASGTFQALMRQISVFEHIPLPTQVEQLELEHLTGASGAPWHLTLRLRVYTTAQISSS